MLDIKGLNAKIDEKTIVNAIDIQIEPSQIHLIMGPNGAGKSSLLGAIMNQEQFSRTGKLNLEGEDLSDLETFELARKGLFLAYQQPVEIPGVHMTEFIRTAHNIQHPDDKYDPWSFREMYDAVSGKVGLDPNFGDRNLNEGFSGGEKKRAEIVQMMLLRPKYAFLDEIDSGLDVVSLKNIFKLVHEFSKEEKAGILLVSHNPNILEYIQPDIVHVMVAGSIVKSGSDKLISEINEKGYTYE